VRGYAGKFIEVDLTSESIVERTFLDETQKICGRPGACCEGALRQARREVGDLGPPRPREPPNHFHGAHDWLLPGCSPQRIREVTPEQRHSGIHHK
jgi:hypothetical protein